MYETRFYGVITPLITPFNRDLSIDFEALEWLVNYHVRSGVNGVFPYSTTGEFVHLTVEEGLKLVEKVVEVVDGRVWVIPGISANCTDHSVELGVKVKDLGVDGAIITPPYFFKVGRDKLKLHFSKVAEKVDLPVIVYNIPSATGINIPVELYVELAEEHENITGAKVTYDSISYLKMLIREVKSVRRDFTVLTGLDYQLLDTLLMGGNGGIMALANVAPKIHVEVFKSWTSGDLKTAHEYFKKLLKLAEIYEVTSSFPTSVKTALKVLGTPVKPYVRPPLTPEPLEIEERVKKILEEVGIYGETVSL